MTDLEDLWAAYPTSDPPVEALLRQARIEARVRRRRRLVRPLLAGTVAAAVASAFVIGAHVGGDGRHGLEAGSGADQGGSLSGPALRHSAFQADLRPAASCNALLASYRARATQEVGAFGWRATVYDTGLAAQAVHGLFDLGGAANSATGTNVQEQGVDEPDEVKTDGSLLARIHGARLSVYDVSGATVRRTARLTLPDLTDGRLLLSGTTLVVLGRDTAHRAGRDFGARVETVSLADPAHPAIVAQVRYSGLVAAARQHGSVVRLVLADTELPALPFIHPHGTTSRHEATLHNRRLVRESSLDDWLPWYDDGSGRRPLLPCTKVALPPGGVALGTTSVVGFHAAAVTKPDAVGLAGATNLAYESADHLYLASSGAAAWCQTCVPLLGARASAPRTRIFQFDLDGTHAAHVATGKVTGAIADSWSMDEDGGVLRAAVSRNAQHASSTSVVTLRRDGARLTEIGSLDGLGVNQTLTAARWFGDLAILSTARRADPLYSVDLSDPAHPRVLGALHIPGFSTYFHPIGRDRLLGVGQRVALGRTAGARDGAQVGLFDISDLADVSQLALATPHRNSWPTVAFDAHAFTWLPDRSTAITSFTTFRGRVLLGEYHVAGATLTQRVTRLNVRASATVRTMELASGRVILIAGPQVSFLAL
jgi:hypothetical protein